MRLMRFRCIGLGLGPPGAWRNPVSTLVLVSELYVSVLDSVSSVLYVSLLRSVYLGKCGMILMIFYQMQFAVS